MSNYEIKRWDVVLSNNRKVPMIYIKPDLTFVDFVRSNNFVIVCEINDTGTIYDGKKIYGIVSKSSISPNCRPNFYNKTGLYVVTLMANWYGYPEPNKTGNAKFFGIKSTLDDKYEKPDKPEKVEKPKVSKENPENKPGIYTSKILIILGVIISILFLLILFRVSHKK